MALAKELLMMRAEDTLILQGLLVGHMFHLGMYNVWCSLCIEMLGLFVLFPFQWLTLFLHSNRWRVKSGNEKIF